MASMTRTIRRGIAFKDMNKQQRLLWNAKHGNKNAQEKLKKYSTSTEKE